MLLTYEDMEKLISFNCRTDKMLTCVQSVLKWKLMHHHELDTWQDVRQHRDDSCIHLKPIS